jgi:hypothetical protein
MTSLINPQLDTTSPRETLHRPMKELADAIILAEDLARKDSSSPD